MNAEAKRLAAESRLEASRERRRALEGNLGDERETTTREIRECAELGTPKTKIAELAGVDRSRVYQILEE